MKGIKPTPKRILRRNGLSLGTKLARPRGLRRQGAETGELPAKRSAPLTNDEIQHAVDALLFAVKK